MLKLQTTALATLAVAGLVLAAGQANAQSSQTLANEPVTLTVQNSFTLARTTAMTFGTFAVVADTGGANTATLAMDEATGTITPTNNAPAKFIVVNTASAARGVYDVTGAAPNTQLSASTANLGNLTCGACGGSPPVITLTSVTPDDTTPTTDNSGAVTINIGAVLTTVAGGNQYEDGSYAGDFDLIVSY